MVNKEIFNEWFEVKLNRNNLTYKPKSIEVSFEIEHEIGEMDIYSNQ